MRLTGAWQDLLARRASNPDTGAYPDAVTVALGEMTAAAVLLQSSIQFDGTLAMQLSGEGPVKLMVAEVDSQLRLRATATLRQTPAEDENLSDWMHAGENGRCSLVLKPDDAQRQSYQGIVPLHTATGEKLHDVAQMIEGYMAQSEQLDTVLMLAANGETAAGMMLQKMPPSGDMDPTAGSLEFEHLATLVRTLSGEELLGLDTETLLHRLFWNEPLLRFTGPEHQLVPSFFCPCSRERVSAMLQGLGEEEVQSILQEQGSIQVACEFCGQQEHFDAIDATELFKPGLHGDSSTQIH